MVAKEVISIARQQIGLYFQSEMKDKNVSVHDIKKATGLSFHVINSILTGKNYSIDSFIIVAAYFDTHIELSPKSLENSIMKDIAPLPVGN